MILILMALVMLFLAMESSTRYKKTGHRPFTEKDKERSKEAYIRLQKLIKDRDSKNGQ